MRFFKILITLLSLMSFVYSGNVGDVVINKVIINYNLCGIHKSKILTNSTPKIVETNATIEFLRYSNSKKSKYYDILSPTKYKNSEKKFIDMDKPILDDNKSIDVPSKIYMQSSNRYYMNDLAIIRVKDIDKNINSQKIDKIVVKVYNKDSGDIEELELYESGVNSGVFIGYIQLRDTKKSSYDGVLSVNEDDKIFVEYSDNSSHIVNSIANIIQNDKDSNEELKTDAKIDFLKYGKDDNISEDNATFTLTNEQISRYKNSKGDFVKNSVLLPSGKRLQSGDELVLYKKKEYYEDDLVVIKVDDLDQNSNDDKIDYIDIEVYNPSNGDKEFLRAYETTTNSGIFVGYLQSTSKEKVLNDGKISVKEGDYIYTYYYDESRSKKIDDKALIVKKPLFLFAFKWASVKKASVGDFFKYTISIENLQNFKLYNLKLYDKLPQGIKYQIGSFKSSKDKNISQKFSISKYGRLIEFNIGSIEAKEKIEFSYVVEVGAVSKKMIINSAWSKGKLEIASNVAQNRVLIDNDLFIDKGFIVGRVVDNECKDNNSSSCNLENIKIYMEDGRYVLTDKRGRFHFVDISRGDHVLQIDPLSINERFKVISCKENTQYAKRANSAFVTIRQSELKRVNFCLKSIKKDIKKSSKIKFVLDKSSNNILNLKIDLSSKIKLIDPEVYIALPDGIEYIKNPKDNAQMIKGILVVSIDSLTKSIKFRVNKNYPIDDNIEATLYYDTKIEQDKHTKIYKFHISNHKGNILIKNNILKDKIITNNNSLDFNWTKANVQTKMPQFTPKKVDSYGKKPKIIWPPKAWVPKIPSTKIAILKPKNSRLELSLNGNKVNPINYEKSYKNSDNSMQIIYYKGVDLKEGQNIINATIKDSNNNIIAEIKREIWVESHLPKDIIFLPKYSYLKADGIHTPIIALKFIAKSGHPLRGGLVGSFEVNSRYKPNKLVNSKGYFKIEDNGIAYIRLKPTTNSGIAKLKFKLIDNKTKTIRVKIEPKLRDWFVVGVASGSVAYDLISSHLKKVDKTALDIDGKVAFFAKGMVKGKWLLTIVYDNKKANRELFDKIDPNRYYLVFDDNSKQYSEAPSTKKLYIKIEKDDFYAMYGDFKSDISNSKFNNYNRSFTGFKAKYNSDKIRANIFVARSNKLHLKDELRGDGTYGYYYLKNKNIVENSEKVTIEVRDRLHRDIILSKKELVRFSDYNIDYIDGKIYFKEPIYSKDKDLNPIYIIVEYDVENSNKNHYTIGGEVGYFDKNYTINLSAIKEDSGVIDSNIIDLKAKYNITNKLSFDFEIARSHTKEDKNITNSLAKYFALNYEENNLSLKNWYQSQDEGFGLGKLSDTLNGSKQIGFEVEKKINKNYSISAEVYKDSSRDTILKRAQTSLAYKDKNSTIKLSLRRQKSNSQSKNYIVSNISKRYKNFSYSLTHEQVLGEASSNNPNNSILNLNYKINKKSNLTASISREDRGDDISWNSNLAFSYKPWKNANIQLSRLMQNSGDIDSIFDTLMFKQKFTFSKRYSLDLGYEHGISQKGDKKSFDALNAIANYKDSKQSANMGISVRYEGLDKKYNVKFGYIRSLDKNQEIIFGVNFNDNKNKNSKQMDTKANLSYVYRDSNITILNKLELSSNRKKDLEDSEDKLKLVNNLHINWQLTKKLEIGAQYGLKYLIDNIDKKEYDSLVDFFALWAKYDIYNDISLGAQFGILHSYSAKNSDYNFGIFITKNLWENADITLGYNIHGFQDRDFNLQNNYTNRVYLKFRIKFDQSDLKNITDWIK